MELIIYLDSESVCKIVAVQEQTGQDIETIVRQGISVYYQQIQPHCQIVLENIVADNLIVN